MLIAQWLHLTELMIDLLNPAGFDRLRKDPPVLSFNASGLYTNVKKHSFHAAAAQGITRVQLDLSDFI